MAERINKFAKKQQEKNENNKADLKNNESPAADVAKSMANLAPEQPTKKVPSEKTAKKEEKPKATTKVIEKAAEKPAKKDNVPAEQIMNSLLIKNPVDDKKKTVRKSYMFSPKAAENLEYFSSKAGRTQNDFLNELLLNLDKFVK